MDASSKMKELDTPLGKMVAVADCEAVCLLEFADSSHLSIDKDIKQGTTQPLAFLETELKQYFTEGLDCFRTPVAMTGSVFQKEVWRELQKIPFGTTCSYLDLATALQRPRACRAVAQANGANRLAIIIPCHRVIQADGNIGGYSGGVARKKWLCSHESHMREQSLLGPASPK